MGCCGQDVRTKLVKFADRLKVQHPKEAQVVAEVVQRVDRLADRATIKATAGGGVSKHIKRAPKAVDKYYEACLKNSKQRYPKKEDLQAYCIRVALDILCQHVTPNHLVCRGRK